MGWHKEEVVKAYNAATDPKVKAKYQWIIDYHNSTIEGIPAFDPVRIKTLKKARRTERPNAT